MIENNPNGGELPDYLPKPKKTDLSFYEATQLYIYKKWHVWEKPKT